MKIYLIHFNVSPNNDDDIYISDVGRQLVECFTGDWPPLYSYRSSASSPRIQHASLTRGITKFQQSK